MRGTYRDLQDTDRRTRQADLAARSGKPCFAFCVDCGCRLSDGVLGMRLNRRGALVRAYPRAQYGPPGPDVNMRCPTCFKQVAGGETMAHEPPAEERSALWHDTQQQRRLRARIVAQGHAPWWDTEEEAEAR